MFTTNVMSWSPQTGYKNCESAARNIFNIEENVQPLHGTISQSALCKIAPRYLPAVRKTPVVDSPQKKVEQYWGEQAK
jgi:hypothetical protein